MTTSIHIENTFQTLLLTTIFMSTMKTTCVDCGDCKRFVERLHDVPPIWQTIFDHLWENSYGIGYPSFVAMTCSDRYDFVMALENDVRYYSMQDMIHPGLWSLPNFFAKNEFIMALATLVDTWNPKFSQITLRTILRRFFEKMPTDRKLTDDEWIDLTRSTFGKSMTESVAKQITERGKVPPFEMLLRVDAL